jgi:hypothetical protein
MSTDQEDKRPSGRDEQTEAHSAYENYELPVEGFEGSAEEIERQWYE